ncbi:hypothetical protein MAPG_10604 [Magnaporthiopsis poae ATCC 64411]|uniref:Uncharacterized protein n=1 Tax=Magnaporthiopsis poae (strain ATCC 64411 / 73-15) TaxID=644358 RepID=A0A0C4ED13_MAGP6|nr:hypothetical protein MAPG_10604 [Magnaporthiopsis poae ATCC 64411]
MEAVRITYPHSPFSNFSSVPEVELSRHLQEEITLQSDPTSPYHPSPPGVALNSPVPDTLAGKTRHFSFSRLHSRSNLPPAHSHHSLTSIHHPPPDTYLERFLPASLPISHSIHDVPKGNSTPILYPSSFLTRGVTRKVLRGKSRWLLDRARAAEVGLPPRQPFGKRDEQLPDQHTDRLGGVDKSKAIVETLAGTRKKTRPCRPRINQRGVQDQDSDPSDCSKRDGSGHVGTVKSRLDVLQQQSLRQPLDGASPLAACPGPPVTQATPLNAGDGEGAGKDRPRDRPLGPGAQGAPTRSRQGDSTTPTRRFSRRASNEAMYWYRRNLDARRREQVGTDPGPSSGSSVPVGAAPDVVNPGVAPGLTPCPVPTLRISRHYRSDPPPSDHSPETPQAEEDTPTEHQQAGQERIYGGIENRSQYVDTY